MARMFYLSLVYDAEGYRRFDMVKSESLVELDKIISKFKGRKDVLNTYYKDYKKDNQKGKVCIIYEDLDLKKRQLEEVEGVRDEEYKERLRKEFSYAHIIPILYKGHGMFSVETCIKMLRRVMFSKSIEEAITLDTKTKSGETIKTNKKYIFETEEQKDLLGNKADYKGAVESFFEHIGDYSYEDQYFYCRTLIEICGLGVDTINTKSGTIKVREGNVHNVIHEMSYKDIMTDSDRLREETSDMDDFYLHHDLDEVIRLSPDENKPIGSVGRSNK